MFVCGVKCLKYYSKLHTGIKNAFVDRGWQLPLLFGSLLANVNALHKAFAVKNLVVQVQGEFSVS